MTIIQSIILGVVEGLTEFLPISSTGHLILASKILGISNNEFTKSFEITIQCGAILAVVFLYWRKIFENKHLWKKILIAFLPTAMVGFLLYKVLKNYLLQNAVVVVWALTLGGIFLILFELWYAKRTVTPNEELNSKQAFIIGLIQSLSIIPGISRAGATIIGGMLQGINRKSIVEFSFLLAVPTIAAASVYDLYKNVGSFSVGNFGTLAVGFVVSFLVAIVAITWFLQYVKNNTFIVFGIYRIVIAVLFWIFILR